MEGILPEFHSKKSKITSSEGRTADKAGPTVGCS